MLQTKFLVSGSSISVVSINDETALDKLPPRVYTLQFNTLTGFYLNITKDQLEVPEKIYGNTPERVNRCLSTYQDRKTATGILLTGDKGTGKTLLMSLLANLAITELGLPVILVKEAYAGDQFVSFIESLGECCVVFDEFGKMYAATSHDDRPHQNTLLSLFDGVDKSKRLVIFTENRELDVSEFMLNRPSRIYYHFRYSKLDEQSIIGYCEDYDVPEEIIRDIIDKARRSKIFSFDMLQSIVEEYHRFSLSIDEVIADLNIDVRESNTGLIEILRIVSKSTNTEIELVESPYVTKPLERYSHTYIKIKSQASRETDELLDKIKAELDSDKAVEASDSEDYDEIYIAQEHLAYEVNGQMVYDTDEYLITAKDVPIQRYNYENMF